MLNVKNLSTYFYLEDKLVKAVDDVSFSVERGEVLGIVGESGSGKSTIALSILRLIYPPGKVVSGEVNFCGQDLLKLAEEKMIKIRGARISIIFQDPFTSLNPVFAVGDQISEAIQLHQRLDKRTAWQKAIEMLDTVHIKNPAIRIKDYPHQFSGGMRQRVMIAMSLACKPELLIADEPTTALDVTIQAETLKLLMELQSKFKLSVIYITHNFGIVKHICNRVVVMYKGKVVEKGKTLDVFEKPGDSYTRKLIECLELFKRGGRGGS